MALSLNAVQGTDSNKTVRMTGNMCGKEVIILIDSGSTHNFISEALASRWRSWTELETPMHVRVENGQILHCSHEITACPVWISGYAFNLPLKVLLLHCYDLILGIDWLEQHSPMEVDWMGKWLSFDYQGRRALLQGILPQVQSCEVITPHQLTILEHQDQLWCLLALQPVDTSQAMYTRPPKVQQLVDKFSSLFLPPTGLPPKRASEHTIPLLPGAQPFRLRPYRYNSAQKDDIESQVKQLLSNGWIRESQSPYASPVLLVKKKTGDWRLCVDYRKLNALTVKNKFPLLVIDEMLDDLVGAKWFTTLDMSSGFHQILVAEADVANTTFQTHNGHQNTLSCHMVLLEVQQHFSMR